ncbi:MAG: hypothetical protein FJZ88_06580, partial [Chloroflexi bacterium]|nr:hypothetical protein [Chloroflexota bacterium]
MQKAERTPASALKIGLLYRLQPVLRFAGFSPLGLILLVTLAIVPLFIEDEYILRLLVVILLLGTQAMAFDFTVGFINVVNFGFAAFVGVGAYTSGL